MPHLLGIQFDGTIGIVEALLNDGGQFTNTLTFVSNTFCVRVARMIISVREGVTRTCNAIEAMIRTWIAAWSEG